MNIPDWYLDWINFVNVQVRSEGTRVQYDKVVRQWINAGMPEPAAWVAGAEVWQDGQLMGGTATRNKRRNAMRQLQKFAARHHLSLFPAHFEMPQSVDQPHPPQIMLSEDDVSELLRRIEEQSGPHAHAAAVLLYTLGGRKTETLVRLRVRDLHLDADPPHVTIHGKGSKDRDVPVSERTVSYIRRYVAHHRYKPAAPDLDYVLLTPEGLPVDGECRFVIRAVRRALESMVADGTLGADTTEIMQRPGFKPLHLLRNRRMTHLYQRSRDPEAVRKFAGHGSISTTLEFYVSRSLKDLAEIVVDTADVGVLTNLEVLTDRSA